MKMADTLAVSMEVIAIVLLRLFIIAINAINTIAMDLSTWYGDGGGNGKDCSWCQFFTWIVNKQSFEN